ncbi:putative fatty acid elongase [Leishmania major strain Friedlin]|uniref:Elongation of fatty acids protein n=1 Tax=Leishmania major TaxID=5664 RepID=Q4QFR1_LEIMA|nr:putative fatty acid elongase [Leishmania major strain Friedlin]CAG9571261.1 fatty_acid_elongase_-_putative [Leishmania major strain Friedlin]CAJ03023.1 putative fatty acid elongase [Leishmania major strain Friedlin]|eukprot:XP_001687673.1 putative fatty acid elongase [Leishmania major strain Friedlin]
MEALRAAWDWINYRPRRFSAENGRDFLDRYPDYPVYATVLYLLAVLYLPDLLARRQINLPIKYIVAAWNLFLSVVSTYGVFCIYGHIQDVFSVRTFHNSVCELLATSGANDIITLRAIRVHAHQQTLIEQRHLPVKWVRSTPEVAKEITSLYDGAAGFSVAMFMYLKTPELLDTLFLVLQRKPVSFLHWYHHIVTAIYVWLSSYMPMPSGIVFCAMNYFVHSFMYFYYFLVMMGLRKSIRPFAPVITLLQVLQMFIGMYITVYTYFQYWLGPEYSNTLFFQFFEVVLSNAYYAYCNAKSVVTTGALASQVPAFDMSDRFWGCDSDPTCMRMGMLMYGSYCVLFAVLFKELYLDKRVHENSLVLARKEQQAREDKVKSKMNGNGVTTPAAAGAKPTAA